MTVQAPFYLALPLLLYLPGWALHRRVGTPAEPLVAHFERVAIGTLWCGWLALLLAEVGLFSLWLHVLITFGGCAALALRAPRPAPSAPSATPRWECLAHIIVLLIALLLVARPFETVLGVRDAGVYANTGFAIARTGSLVQTDALLAQWGQAALSTDATVAEPAKQALANYTIGQPRDRYIATRLRAAGFFVYEGELPAGRIVPQGLHLLPAWIALLTALGGPYLGLFAPGLLSVLSVWSVGMLGRRLAGPWVGLLAMSFLALNGTQIWFGRYSTAETTAQFLIFTGLYFFAQQEDDANPHTAMVAAALSGLAIGQVALARLDFFLLGPVLVYLLYVWLTHRWARRHTALALGLGAMLLHAALHIALIARAYFFDTAHDRLQDYALVALCSLPFLTPALRTEFLSDSALAHPMRLVLEVVAVAIAGGVVAALWRWPAPIRRAEQWLARHNGAVLRLVAGGMLLLAGYAYLVRPEIFDADMFFNTRGGWNDPLTRDPALVALDVREGRMQVDAARNAAGVALSPGPFWRATPDLAATTVLRERLQAERGPWAGSFSTQSLNWLRLQGYVGAPISLPVRLWYNEYASMTWLQQLTVNPATLSSEPAPINDKYMIPLANLVRVGWYLSPLGMLLGLVGYALWLRRGLNRAAWLFLAVAFVGTFFYVRQTYGTSDQHYIYILRRFVPITYPALSLGMAYALVALAQHAKRQRVKTPLRGLALLGVTGGLGLLQIAFYLYTNIPIITHTEYAGAIAQLTAAAAQFVPGRDVLLMRGGAPIYAEARDIPDLVATPFRYAFGLDAFAVKSTQPGKYADALTLAAQQLRAQGREVYLLLSTSGGSLALPGFALEPAGHFALDIPEFEQLTDQKPRNVARLSLPFAIYKLVPAAPNSIATNPPPLDSEAFAAQVTGFHRPETRTTGESYAWTNGEATLRLPWSVGAVSSTLRLTLAGGERPPQLGQAQVCVSALPETTLWPTTSGTPTELGCLTLGTQPDTYTLNLDPAQLPPAPSGTLLVRLTSSAWVPASEDARQSDRRSVGVQVGLVALE